MHCLANYKKINSKLSTLLGLGLITLSLCSCSTLRKSGHIEPYVVPKDSTLHCNCQAPAPWHTLHCSSSGFANNDGANKYAVNLPKVSSTLRGSKKEKKQKTVTPEQILMEKKIDPPPAPSQDGVSIRVSLENLRAWLYINGEPTLVTPITPGKRSTPTPKGKFKVINKHRHWVSTIYNVPMPYFLRLNPGYFGLHQGQMRVQPASHGCVRLPQKEASEFFASTPIGTPVWIE